MTDRSSRPLVSPSRLSVRVERRIIALRFTRRWGPHRISYHLGVPRSSVGRVIARYRMPLLAHVDQSAGLRVRKPAANPYEVATPGELVHVDINGCDPNYADACVPIASDVDCAWGSGDGPADFDGVARVVGRDIYGLDRDGDGWACER